MNAPSFTVLALVGALATSALPAVATPQASGAPPPEAVAFEHVRVLPMDSARALEDQTVLIRGPRIMAVGKAGEVEIPPGAVRIDGRGATLLPGLADMHVHLYSRDDLLNYLAHGVTTVLDLNGSPRARAWRDHSRLASSPTPTLYLAGPTLNGYPPGNPSFVSLLDAGLAAQEVRRQRALGYDVVKVYSLLPPPVYRAVMETADEEGMTVVGHVPLHVGLESALEAGQGMIAHGEELWKVVGRSDSARVRAAVAAIRSSGAWVTPNLSAIDRIIAEAGDLPALAREPEAAFMPPATYSEWMPSNNRYWGADTASFLPEMRAEADFVRRVTAWMSDAGVPLLVGTDSPVFGFAGASAHHELQLLVEAGLTPYEALAAATSSAGDFAETRIGSGERFGRVAPGYRADLLLVERDPLTDVAALRELRGVMARGSWWPAERLDSLRHARRDVHQPLRARVRTIDSLIVAGEAERGLDLLEATRREHPGVPLVADVVLWSWGRRLVREGDGQSARAARRLFETMIDADPLAQVAWIGLADAALAGGDTTTAREALAYALELSPSHAGLCERSSRLESAGRDPSFPVPGVYVLRTHANVGGDYVPVELVLTLEPSGATWTGRIESDTPLPVLEVTTVEAGADRLWVSAPFDGRSLDLRLTVEGSEVRGSWNLGFSEQGLLEGRRR